MKKYRPSLGDEASVDAGAAPLRDGASKAVSTYSASAAYLAAIVNSSQDAIIGKTLEGTITSWNPAAERIFGYTASEAIGKPMLIIFPTDRAEEEWALLDQVAAGKPVPYFETQRIRKDGRVIDVSVTLSPIKDPSGKVIGVSKIARDITQQRERERELARMARLYSALGEVNQCIARSKGREELYQGVCNALVDHGKFLIAWMGIHDPTSHEIIAAASSGDSTNYLGAIHVFGDDRPEGRGPTGIAFREGHTVVCNDMLAQDTTLPWREQFEKRGIRASASFPVTRKGSPFGVLSVYSDEVDFFKDKEVALLEEAAGDVSFALDSLITAEGHARAEASLRESEERFRQIAENINEVFWIADPVAGGMLYVSPAYRKIWGRSCEELYASLAPWFESVHPDDREAARGRILTTKRESAHDETYRIVRPDGETRWIRERGFPILNDQGQVYRFVGTAEDVTTRRVYLERITEQASVIDAAHEAISVRDLEGRITYWNKGAERTFGWFADEVLGKTVAEVFSYNEARLAEALKKTLEEGTWDGEVMSRTKEGKKICIMVHWTLIRDDHGKPKSILAINTDVTEKKALEAQFLRAQRLESIGTLAGGIAHDLNNLLAPIIMGIDLLKTSDHPVHRRQIIANMELAARHGADLVKQVLSFARGLEGSKVSLNPRYTIRDVAAILHGTFPKNIAVESDVEPRLWNVSADPTQINQVLMNLCVNARDAMPEGGRVTIKARNIEIDDQYAITMGGVPQGKYVQVDVSDSGCGIPKEILERVFEPFFTTKAPGKGTGLGLSTVLGIVRSHGGFVRVDSETGKGTTFKVFLPALVHETTVGEGAPGPQDLPFGHGETILVVDDEEAVLSITRQTLQTFGYVVVSATNGAQAISAYAMHRDKVAAVVTDMMMPVMDGNAVINALLHLNPSLPIIATSGRAVTPGSRPIVGIRRFIAKPYSAATLLGALKAVLEPAPADPEHLKEG